MEAKMENNTITEVRMAAAKNFGEDPKVLIRFTAGFEESTGAPQGHWVPSGIVLPHFGHIINQSLQAKREFVSQPSFLNRYLGTLLLYYRIGVKKAMEKQQTDKYFLFLQSFWGTVDISGKQCYIRKSHFENRRLFL